jgi:hypothetical protein
MRIENKPKRGHDTKRVQATSYQPHATGFHCSRSRHERTWRPRSASVLLALIHVGREALTIRVEVRDLHRCSCRSRAA